MATNRTLATYFIVIMPVLATAAALLLISWMGTTSVAIMQTADLSITKVQFDKDYLTITVKNQGTHALTINEVTVSEATVGDEGMVNQTSTPYTFSVHAPVSAGEQISICINFKWTSGYLHQIKLETTSIADFSPAALCFVRAP